MDESTSISRKTASLKIGLQVFLGGLVGLLTYLNYVPASYLGGFPDDYCINGDNAAQLAAAHYFVQDSWHFPLLHTDLLCFPDGVNVAFADCLPIVAIPLKLFNTITGLSCTVDYLYLWIGLCLILQGVMAVLISRALGGRSMLQCVSAACFFVGSTVLLLRFNHPALCGQFVLLWAFYLYIRSKQSGLTLAIQAGVLLLIVTTLLIHIYLLAMVLVLVIAIYGQALMDRRQSWVMVTSRFVITSVVLILSMYLFGHLGFRSIVNSDNGFGLYSMNLASPFSPLFSVIFPQKVPFDATGGQYEGISYLGLGLIILCFIAIIFNFRHCLHLVRRHWVLVMLLIGLVGYSLSCKVYFNDHLILSRRPVILEELFNQFRASGRFYWPVHYGIIIGSLCLIYNWRWKRTALIVIAILGICQIYEAQGHKQLYRYGVSDFNQYAIAEMQALETLMTKHRRLYIFPYYFCQPAPGNRFIAQMIYQASKHAIPVNTAYTARRFQECVSPKDALDMVSDEPGAMLILLKPEYNANACRRFTERGFDIREFSQGYVLANRTLFDLLPEKVLHPLPTSSFNPAGVNHWAITEKTLPGDGSLVLQQGFSNPESTCTWTDGATAIAQIDMRSSTTSTYVMTLIGLPFINEQIPSMAMIVQVNQTKVATRLFHWPNDAGKQVIAVTLPTVLIQAHDTIQIELHISDPHSPAEFGISTDSRKLGFALTSICLEPVPVNGNPLHCHDDNSH